MSGVLRLGCDPNYTEFNAVFPISYLGTAGKMP